jgi:hypothetical protein
MATHLRPRTAIHTVADICAAIAAGLDSDAEAKSNAPLWDALTAKCDALVLARRSAERTLGRIRAKLAVLDARWDHEVGAFGRHLFEQSGGKRDQPPYTRFFNKATPSDVQDFGIDREVNQGRTWLAELAREPNEPLATQWTPRLETSTHELETGSKNRRIALQAVALQDTAEELFIDDVNREIDILEGDLLKRFPGQPKRVAAFLEPTKPRRRARDDDADDKNA